MVKLPHQTSGMANLPRYTINMSRSYHNKNCGRGCGVCGDAGESRRAVMLVSREEFVDMSGSVQMISTKV